MTKNAEKIYLFLAHWIKAYGYSPPKTTICEHCGVSELQVDKWLHNLANRGYIKLYKYDDGSYKATIMIDPTTPWDAVLHVDDKGRPTRLVSELPLRLHIFREKQIVPEVVMSEKDLLKERMKKAGIL